MSTKLSFFFLVFLWPFFQSFGQTSSSSDSVKSQSNLETIRQKFWDSLPQPTNYVNDLEDIFTHKEEEDMNAVLKAYEKSMGVEIAVVTLDSMYCTKEKFDDLTLHIAKTWEIGKMKNFNGILIGICTGHRKIRIQNGKGISEYISDEETRLIIQSEFIIPFKNKEYYIGTNNGISSIMSLLNTRI